MFKGSSNFRIDFYNQQASTAVTEHTDYHLVINLVKVLHE